MRIAVSTCTQGVCFLLGQKTTRSPAHSSVSLAQRLHPIPQRALYALNTLGCSFIAAHHFLRLRTSVNRRKPWERSWTHLDDVKLKHHPERKHGYARRSVQDACIHSVTAIQQSYGRISLVRKSYRNGERSWSEARDVVAERRSVQVGSRCRDHVSELRTTVHDVRRESEKEPLTAFHLLSSWME